MMGMGNLSKSDKLTSDSVCALYLRPSMNIPPNSDFYGLVRDRQGDSILGKIFCGTSVRTITDKEGRHVSQMLK